MVDCSRGLVAASILLLTLLGVGSPSLNAASSPTSVGATIRQHDLFVQIDPHRHAMVAMDRMTIDLPPATEQIRFSLASTVQVDRVVLAVEHSSSDKSDRDLPFEIDHVAVSSQPQHVTVPAAILPTGTVTLTAYYHGVINDPPKEPRHLRFVTPSETAGHIGPEGVYLSSESNWYPDLPESLSTYRLRVALPSGWTAVSQGKPLASEACPASLCQQTNHMLVEWNLGYPSEALTLVANRFVSKTRTWTGKSGQSVEIAAYLMPENAPLADEYLDATARYLEAYILLLGPYPFDTFAVVENFFASGLGMPSFTLLGSGIIKRHYVQPYALGHEIVHSWIGNSVFNRTDRGNWVEGLTTYLANYYWHELSGDQQQAGDQRRLMLRGYNLHVPPDRDYPVVQFTRKQDERDNAVGYQKSAMIFHLLRQEVGEEVFWPALKRFIAQYRWRHAEWSDLERVFADAARRDLRWFFAQWIEQDGAPEISLQAAVARPIPGNAEQGFQLAVTIGQTDRAFRLTVPLRMIMEDGSDRIVYARVSGASNLSEFKFPKRPKAVELDPDAMVIRRIPRGTLPPVLNHYVTDRRRSLMIAVPDASNGSHPFHDVVKRIETQDRQKLEGDRALIAPLGKHAVFREEGSVLVLGTPEFRADLQALLNSNCGDRLTLREDGVLLDGTAYDGADVAVLISCHRGDHPGSVVTLLYAVTPRAATTVARLLFFYGWNSYIIFKQGSVVARGEWAVTQDRMEVAVDERNVVR